MGLAALFLLGLAIYFLVGLFAPKVVKEQPAFAAKRKSIATGVILALVFLPVFFDFAKDFVDVQRYVHEKRVRAEAGDITAQSELGWLYSEGMRVRKDGAEAAHWFQLAADQGNATAQGRLARIYETGQDVPPDAAKAVLLYTKAATIDPDYAYPLAELLRQGGKGVEKNPAEALKWYRMAAAGSWPDLRVNAMMRMVQMYHLGAGVAQDDAEAYFWAGMALRVSHYGPEAQELQKKLVARASPDAIAEGRRRLTVATRNTPQPIDAVEDYKTGMKYYYSPYGTPQDYQKALNWLRKAAEQGHAEAMYIVGDIYQTGQGVKKDLAAAYFWYGVAAARYASANFLRDSEVAHAAAANAKAKGEFSVEETAELDRRIKEWLPQPK